ncbi:MAG: hypothetical protein M3Y17_06910 [Actinomycetota bacterium]|nr:hypothetical protein [Actinomycetota bacterium]
MQSTIGRWETGAREPRFAEVTKALWACGFELGQWLSARDASLIFDSCTRLELAPLERLRKVHGSAELAGALSAVASSGVQCVVLGEVAGALQGWGLSLGCRVLELVVGERGRDCLLAVLGTAGAAPVAMPDRQPRWRADGVERLVLPAGTGIELIVLESRHAPRRHRHLLRARRLPRRL